MPKRYQLEVTVRNFKGVSRTIEIGGEYTLQNLHTAIQSAFDFDDDHLYSFFMSGKAWDETTEYALPESAGMMGMEGDDPDFDYLAEIDTEPSSSISLDEIAAMSPPERDQFIKDKMAPAYEMPYEELRALIIDDKGVFHPEKMPPPSPQMIEKAAQIVAEKSGMPIELVRLLAPLALGKKAPDEVPEQAVNILAKELAAEYGIPLDYAKEVTRAQMSKKPLPAPPNKAVKAFIRHDPDMQYLPFDFVREVMIADLNGDPRPPLTAEHKQALFQARAKALGLPIEFVRMMFERIEEEERMALERDVRKVTIDSLELKPRKKFLYLFDYGDDWRFDIKVKKILEVAQAGGKPELIAAEGEAPLQYPNYDEYDDEEYFEEPEDFTQYPAYNVSTEQVEAWQADASTKLTPELYQHIWSRCNAFFQENIGNIVHASEDYLTRCALEVFLRGNKALITLIDANLANVVGSLGATQRQGGRIAYVGKYQFELAYQNGSKWVVDVANASLDDCLKRVVENEVYHININ
jgi:antitoxin component of RelBE/YafQ-DinJ toxin-antitoxin module